MPDILNEKDGTYILYLLCQVYKNQGHTFAKALFNCYDCTSSFNRELPDE